MADLSGSFVKVNDVEVAQDAPVTEALLNKIGVDLNYLKDHITTVEGYAGSIKLNYQTYTSGTGTWTAPANLKGGVCFIMGVGGGGGGGGGQGGSPYTGGDGGRGAAFAIDLVAVSPSTGYSYTVGNGGSGGSAGTGAAGNIGGTGGATIFNGSILSYGARGGVGGAGTYTATTRTTYYGLNAGQTEGGLGKAGVADGLKGQPSTYRLGGDGGPTASAKGGGGGGGGSYGTGGTGGTGGVNNATAGGYGAGGGGGCGSSPTGGDGAAGGNGILMIVWFESAF